MKINAHTMGVFTRNVSFIKGSRGCACLLYGRYFCNKWKYRTNFQETRGIYVPNLFRMGAANTTPLTGPGGNETAKRPPAHVCSSVAKWAKAFVSWLMTEMAICLSLYLSGRRNENYDIIKPILGPGCNHGNLHWQPFTGSMGRWCTWQACLNHLKHRLANVAKTWTFTEIKLLCSSPDVTSAFPSLCGLRGNVLTEQADAGGDALQGDAQREEKKKEVNSRIKY